MKNLFNLLLACLAILFVACSGSDTYRGKWKATNADGEKFEIVFQADSVSIIDSTGEVTNYEYSQNSVAIDNAVKTYGIKLDDGRLYSIRFPNADEVDKAVILANENEPVYAISRNEYVDLGDLYKLNQ